MIDLVGNIDLGDAMARSADVLGHVFEYFLGELALAEGKKGSQFYTPRSVVELLVEMLEPYKDRVFDPCCGSGGMFVPTQKTNAIGLKATAGRYGGTYAHKLRA